MLVYNKIITGLFFILLFISSVKGYPQGRLEHRPGWGVSLSNAADDFFRGSTIWDQWGRPYVHGVWHTGMGIINNNPYEIRRAATQFGRLGYGGGWNGQSGRGIYN